MKMRSYFLGFNAKLALMLIAICGMFAGCYEKDEIDVPAPSTQAPQYYVGGLVIDAETGAPLSGATVTDGTASGTTDTNGKYVLETKEGIQVIKISKGGYKEVVTSINVLKLANGEVATYLVNASLYPEVKYMDNVYSIEGSAYDENGNLIDIETAKIPGLTVNVAADKHSFSTTGTVEAGAYTAIVTAKDYNTAYATVVVSEAGKVVGEGENKIVTKVRVIMQKAAEAAKYFVEGNIRNENGAAVSGATLSVMLAGQEIPCTYTNGYFKGSIPAENVPTATMITVRVSKGGYYPYAASSLILPVKAGEISVTSFNITMKAIKDVEEDPSVGGSSVADVIQNGTTAFEPANTVKDLTVEGGASVEDLLQSIQETTGVVTTLPEDVPVVTVDASGVNTELVSEIVKVEGSTSTTVTEVDQIKIQPETKVIYTKGVAENISVSRDVAAEKTSAAARAYEGTPDGAIFTKPLQIAFNAPVAGNDIDFVLPVLYYNSVKGSWVADGDNVAEFDASAGKFVAKVAHFSKFKFGYEDSIKVSGPVELVPPVTITKSCYTGAASKLITVKGTYEGGSKYVDQTPAMAAAAALSGMKQSTITYVANLLTNMIKADNVNILPLNEYVATEFSYDITIPAYQQVTGFDITRSEITKTYTVKVVTADGRKIDVDVVVKSISSVKVSANKEESHGHGHGDDLNAGGGIVTLD